MMHDGVARITSGEQDPQMRPPLPGLVGDFATAEAAR